MKRVASWLVCGLVGSLAAAEIAVPNGGFERVENGATVGWRTIGSTFTYQDGMGRNGTRALCYANDDPSFYRFPSQTVALKPGRVYEFEVWVRTENLQGQESGATVCIEWDGPDGHWLGGAYTDGVKGTRDWTLVKGVTTEIPAEARNIHISPYVRKGMTGKAWFDDLAVRERRREPVASVCSSAYRNVAASGDVTFRAALNVPDDVRQPEKLSLWFSYRDAQGNPVRVQAKNLLRDRITLPVESLAMGTQTVTAELVDGQGVCLGRSSCDFTHLAEMPKRAVSFDKAGRTLVDGRPFFPLGMYWSAVTTNLVELYAKSPFNCLMPYNAPNSRDLMDLCAEKGLKVIYSVKDIYSDTRWAPEGIKTLDDEERYIMDRVARFKDHPALLAWYLNDELPLTMLPRLTARRDLMERLDPDHPGWVVLYQYTQIRDYLPSFDVIGTDPYPIPDKSAATASEWTRLTVHGAMGKPVWQVPQAFDWGLYKPAHERDKYRAPTEAELRSMCWQCIANGANGLILYSFFDLRKPGCKEPFEQRWAECCRVAAEIRAQMPILLSDEGDGKRLASGPYGPFYVVLPKDVKRPKYPFSMRAWQKDGKTYVLVVNGCEIARTVRVGLLEKTRTVAKSVFGPEPKLARPAADGGENLHLVVDLPPFEVAMVELCDK